MLFNLVLLLVFLQFGRPQDFFPFLNPFRLSLLLTILSFYLSAIDSKISLSKVIENKEGRLYIIFYMVMLLGIPFACHRKHAFDYVVLKYMANVLLFILIVANVQTWQKLKKMLLVIMISVFFTAIMSLLKGEFLSGRFSAGTMYDPNDLAYYFVSFLPFFFLFMGNGEKKVIRILAMSGLFLSIVVILLTGSRGGVLGLSVILCFILVTKIVLKGLKIKLLFVAVTIGVITLNMEKINIERLQSVTGLSSDYNMTSETGRLAIWKKGLGLAISNPITGVGVVCFEKAIGEQRTKLGEIPKWQAPHNSFVQVVAETGVTGLGVLLWLISRCFVNFHRFAKRINGSEVAVSCENIPGICLIGLCGSLVCAFFLTQAYSSIFIFYFALSAVLRNLSEQESAAECSQS